MRFPVSPATARKLCAVARPARYGLRERTLQDTRVRDTWEIPAARVRAGGERWERALVAKLAKLQTALGLSADRALRAELHNLLIYAPGQFFAPHQDSEKKTGMVATLVVLLPSTFSGGELVVEHHGEQATHRGSGSSLTFVAFYADCHHQVRPVKSGYRLALTYDLVLEPSLSAPVFEPSAELQPLARSVKAHFETPLPPRWGGRDPRPPPDRLVYLLDHQYTQRGLSWDQLKNADARRAAALKEVATALDCEVFLALADVHESWSCEDEGYARRGGGRWGDEYESDEHESDEHEHEEDGASVDDSDHVLTERIDWDVELRHWLSASGRKVEAISSAVKDDEVCFTRPSVDFQPFRSEHEGYMGNYGNTVDRWYHRAAVVLWPKERTFVIRAKASPAWALREVSKALKAGRPEQARDLLQRMMPSWQSVAGRDPSPALASSAFAVAAGLEDAELATSLLRPLHLDQLTRRAAPALRALTDRFGAAWAIALLTHWDEQHGYRERDAWIGALPALCRELVAGGTVAQLEVARWLLASQLAHVRKRFGVR